MLPTRQANVPSTRPRLPVISYDLSHCENDEQTVLFWHIVIWILIRNWIEDSGYAQTAKVFWYQALAVQILSFPVADPGGPRAPPWTPNLRPQTIFWGPNYTFWHINKTIFLKIYPCFARHTILIYIIWTKNLKKFSSLAPLTIILGLHIITCMLFKYISINISQLKDLYY